MNFIEALTSLSSGNRLSRFGAEIPPERKMIENPAGLHHGGISRRWIKKTVFKKKHVLVFLLLCWLLTTFHYMIKSDIAPSVVSQNLDKNIFSVGKNKAIAVGEFKASSDYLGIVMVRFDLSKANESSLIFRIKEQGNNRWDYESEHKSALYYNSQPYPFGFPVINNSQGKLYLFELELLQNNVNVLDLLNPQKPVVVIKYDFPKSALLGDKKAFLNFALSKLKNNIGTLKFWRFSMLYLSPLLFYLLWQYSFFAETKAAVKKMVAEQIKLFNKPLLKMLILLIIIDAFLIKDRSDILLLIGILLWTISSLKYKMKGEHLFTLSGLLVLLCLIFIALQVEQPAEKAAVWCYVFLVVAVFQSFVKFQNLRLKNHIKL